MASWYSELDRKERVTFWACFGGWALDALDGQMFSVALPALISSFALTKAQAGSLGSFALISSAIGGWLAGGLSDRYGRAKILKLTILWFSVFTFLAAFAQNGTQLLIIRTLQGFGFGGEWAAGAVLIAESIRPEHRGRALGSVQGAWAVGWAAAVLVYSVMFTLLPSTVAWRLMFAVGLAPTLFVAYVQRSIEEPNSFKRQTRKSNSLPGALLGIFHPSIIRVTAAGSLLGLGAHGGYYALMTWLPTYLRTERNLSVLGTGGYLSVIIVAFWLGCYCTAQLLDRIGRRRTITLFAVSCIVTVACYLLIPLTNSQILIVGFPLGFFAAGIPASMGALFNELYPTGVRGTGVGFCYNFGRIASSAFPWVVGLMSEKMPLGRAIGIDAALAYSVVVLAVMVLPETRGKSLEAP